MKTSLVTSTLATNIKLNDVTYSPYTKHSVLPMVTTEYINRPEVLKIFESQRSILSRGMIMALVPELNIITIIDANPNCKKGIYLKLEDCPKYTWIAFKAFEHKEYKIKV